MSGLISKVGIPERFWQFMTDTLFLVDPTTENIIGLVERNPLWEAFHELKAVQSFNKVREEWSLDIAVRAFNYDR